VLLLAIAIQESGLKHRFQWPSGPARSWWQIELSTAVDCCTRCEPVANLCAEIGREYEYSDLAACAIAAGILRLTSGKLPVVGDVDGAWNYYLKAWRPGKPMHWTEAEYSDYRRRVQLPLGRGVDRPERWQEAYGQAVRTIAGPVFVALDLPQPFGLANRSTDVNFISNT
jgi:hypothetical protein